MQGVSRHTGQIVTPIDRLLLSIEDILTTPIGSRVLRRDYGSNLYQHIDKPITAGLKIDIFADTADALRKWEPYFTLERVLVFSAEAGRMAVGIFGRDHLGNGVEIEELVL